MRDVLLVAVLVLLGRTAPALWVLLIGGGLIVLRGALDRIERQTDAERRRNALEVLRTMRMHDPRGPYR